MKQLKNVTGPKCALLLSLSHAIVAAAEEEEEGKEKTQEFKIPSAPRAYFAPYHFATHNTWLRRRSGLSYVVKESFHPTSHSNHFLFL